MTLHYYIIVLSSCDAITLLFHIISYYTISFLSYYRLVLLYYYILNGIQYVPKGPLGTQMGVQGGPRCSQGATWHPNCVQGFTLASNWGPKVVVQCRDVLLL